MHVDTLVAEIGSTTTIVNAFDGLGTARPKFVAQGKAPTTVLDGDVRIGLKNAIDDLLRNEGEHAITYDRMLASGSAAGGLRMTVHGLVRDMTVRAGEAAALGAGAIIVQTTAGKLNEFDIDDLKAVKPNLILLAGGTDYGERETAVFNMRAIAKSGMKTPVVYCGNTIVFTAGVGENGTEFRADVLDKLAPLGIKLNVEANNNIASYKEQHEGIITSPDSSIPVYVLPTNEELMIAKDTYKLVN